MHKKLTITFLSEWQVATGIGDGHLADSMIARNAEGLPWLPGRAVKGALREGARRLGQCRKDLAKAETLFWGEGPTEANRHSGILRVSPALLPENLAGLFKSMPVEQRGNMVRDMTCHRVQTALDTDRQVKHRSLRTLECGIPGLSFEAELQIDMPDWLTETWVQKYLVAVCAAVKSMGGNRSRGLGQCRVTLEGGDCDRVDLPPVMPAMPGGVA